MLTTIPNLPGKPRLDHHWLARYGFALAAAAAALLLREGLTQLAGSGLPPYLTLYPAVMIAAVFGGLGPGLLATGAAALGADYFILPPTGSLAVASLSDAVGLAFFTGMGVFMSALAEGYRRARSRVEAQDAEAFFRAGRDMPARHSPHGMVLNAGLVLSLIILTAGGWQSARNLREVAAADQWETHTRIVIQQFERLLSALKDAETGQRGYLLTGKEPYLEPYLGALDLIQTNLVQLKQLTSDNAAQQQRVSGLEPLVLQKTTELERTIELRRTRGLPAALALVDTDTGKNLMDQIRLRVAGAQAAEDQLLEQRSAAKNTGVGRTLQALLASGTLSLLILVTVFLLLKQENTQRTAAEAELRHHRDHLQETVAARTEALSRSNAELTEEIDEHLQAEEALRQQREWLRVTLTSIGDAVLATDTAGQITFLNPVAETLTGCAENQAVGQPVQNIFRIINEQTRAPGQDIVAQVLRDGKPVALANHTALIRRDGREIPIEDSAAPIRDSSGTVVGVVLVFHDVTERRQSEEKRKQAEGALQQNERLLRDVIDGSTSPISLKDLEGKFITINATLERMLGMSREAIRGKTDYDIAPRELANCWRRHDEEVMAEGKSIQIEEAADFSDGPHIFLANKFPLLNTRGEMYGVGAISHDITARKKAEAALQEREEQLRLFIQHAPAAIAMLDARMCYLAVSQQWLGDYNLAGQQLPGRSHYEVFPEVPERWKEIHRRCLAGGVAAAEEDLFERADGAKQWIRWQICPWHEASGAVGGIVIFTEDITQRKLSEAALRASEARYRALFESMTEGFCTIEMIFDAQGRPVDFRFLEINPAFEKQTGLHEAQGKSMRDLAPDHEAHWFEKYGKIALTGEPATFESEAKALGRHYYVSAWRFGGPESRKVGILFNDITARKQAERDSARLAAIVESSADAIIGRDLDGIITSWNIGAEKLFGYRAGEMLGTSLRRLLPPERHAEEPQVQETIRRGEAVPHFETVRMTKDGRLIAVSVATSPIKDAHGRVVGASKVARDITARKQAEETLRLQAAALEAAANAIVITDRTGTILWFNAAFTELTGYTAAEAIGQNPRVLKSGAHPPEFYRDLWGTVLAGQVWRNEIVNQRKDGSRYTEEMTITPFCDAAGTITHFVAIKQDITGRKRTAEALQRGEERLRTLVSSMRNGLLLVTEDDHIAFANQAFCDYFKLAPKPADLAGLTAKEMIQKIGQTYDHPDQQVARIREIVRRQAPVLGEEVAMQDGRSCLRDFIPISLNETSFGRLWIHTDISERKQMESTLAQAKAELERHNLELEQRVFERTASLRQALTEMEQFAYVASHDLQEPLRTVTSFSQLLARRYQGRLDSDADEFITFMVEAATRMQTLINDLLALSRIGTRGQPFAPIACDEILQVTQKNLDVAMAESGAAITHDPLPTLVADRTQLTQLFQNLFSNAIKFRRPKTAPCIHVSAAREDGGWRLSVRDNGIGIDPRYFERIFIVFQRLHNRDEYPGTGIGLAICKKIVERHGGRLWVESEPGIGATFCFTIPDEK